MLMTDFTETWHVALESRVWQYDFKFRERSTWVNMGRLDVFEWENLLKCYLKENTCKTLENGQNIDYSEKQNGPRAFLPPPPHTPHPCTRAIYHNIEICLMLNIADLR